MPALIAVAPLVGLLALAVRVETPGPGLIRQERLGEGGRLFGLLKLRTMRAGAAPTDEVKGPRDRRVTRLGRVLRRTSLDELPQLVNVVRGEMSLVGPRPELAAVARAHWQAWHWRRLAVPQGLTGRWQVEARERHPMWAQVELDLAYVAGWSLREDLRLLARTPGAVVRGRGAV